MVWGRRLPCACEHGLLCERPPVPPRRHVLLEGENQGSLVVKVLRWRLARSCP